MGLSIRSLISSVPEKRHGYEIAHPDDFVTKNYHFTRREKTWHSYPMTR